MVDWTLRLSDILVVVGFLATVAVLFYRGGKIMSSLEGMQIEITALKTVAAQIATVLTAVAVQKVEIEHLRSDVQSLKRKVEDIDE